MAATIEASAPTSALALQAEILARPITENRRMADVIRALAIDAVEAANSGHPGLPMGMADAATVLWTRFHKFDASAPHWPDRDRFVLSAGHGSMLLYSLLHLTGYAGMSIDQLKTIPANCTHPPQAIPNLVKPLGSRPRPVRSGRGSRPPSAWPSPNASWRRGSASRWSITAPGLSAPTAT